MFLHYCASTPLTGFSRVRAWKRILMFHMYDKYRFMAIRAATDLMKGTKGKGAFDVLKFPIHSSAIRCLKRLNWTGSQHLLGHN